MYYVYKHTLKEDGRVYIGITSKKPEYRWNSGKGYDTCTYFNNAIRKYGWDSFEHEILEEGLTEEEAKEKEVLYIAQYRATESDHGFNIKAGGDLPSDLQLRGVNIYDLDGIFIRKYESLKAASEDLGVNVNSIVLCCKFHDYRHSLDKRYLARYSDEFPEEDLPHGYISFTRESRKVCVYDRMGRFLEVLSSKEASEKYSANITSIYHCCELDGKCAFVGPNSNIFRLYELGMEGFDIIPDSKPRKRRVNCYDLSGKYLSTYSTQAQASRELGVSSRTIGVCCKFALNRAGSYMFRYADDFEEGKDIEPYIGLR